MEPSCIPVSRTVLALMVINKAGGLLYYRDFNPGLNNLDPNELLWLAGTFHGVHVITQQICPPQVAANLNKQTAVPPTSHLTPSQLPTSSLLGTPILNAPSPRLPNASSAASVSSGGGQRPVSSSSGAVGAGLVPSPVPLAKVPTFRTRPTGLQVLETSAFRLHCFQTGTGLKLVLFTDPVHPNPDSLMRKLHELFTDYVLKNPFYTLDMPVRCIKFDVALDNAIRPSVR